MKEEGAVAHREVTDGAGADLPFLIPSVYALVLTCDWIGNTSLEFA